MVAAERGSKTSDQFTVCPSNVGISLLLRILRLRRSLKLLLLGMLVAGRWRKRRRRRRMGG